MSKVWEDLEPGDYVLFDGKPAQKGTAPTGFSVIGTAYGESGIRMHFNVDPVRIEMSEHLTQYELRNLPKGSLVLSGMQEWKRVAIGRGFRWQCPPDVWTDSEMASAGAILIERKPLIFDGMDVTLSDTVETASGNYHATITLDSGIIVRALIILPK